MHNMKNARRQGQMCMKEGRIPSVWMMGMVVPIWKRKGDVHDPGIVEGDFGEEQQGIRKGR